MTPHHLSPAVAVFLFLLFPIRPVSTLFGRRSGAAATVQQQVPPQQQQETVHWSSTGASGLDHRAVKVVNSKNNNSKKKKSPSNPQRRRVDDIDHPSRAFLEHHPYASGVFALDPNDNKGDMIL